MFKMKKIVPFAIVLIICISTLIIKENLNSRKEIYVLSEDSKEMTISENENIDKEESVSSEEVTVYISGEVKKPGIVTIKNGQRLAVAVEKVGGTTKDADLNRINMAIKLEDEKHYIIPKIGEEIDIISNEKNDTNVDIDRGNDSKININSATIEELEKIPGVGEATANKIINYRNENGEFKSIEEIKNVNGIGDKKYEDMKNIICLN